jgi:flagellar hook-basal body complex protein FliE
VHRRSLGYFQKAAIVPAAVALMVVLAGCPGPAELAFGGLTLGALLNQFTGEVQQTLDQAGADISGVLNQAAGQVQDTIDQARVAYEDALNQTIVKGENAVYDQMNNLSVAVQNLEQRTFDSIEQAQKQAQTLFLTLPFANGQPQVRDWNPKFVTDSHDLLVDISGIFTQADKPGETPTLTFGANVLKPTNNGGIATQDLIFDVPVADLPQPVIGNILPASGKLIVPYHSPLLHSDETGTFYILFGILPQAAGTLIFQHIVHNEQPVSEPQTSPIIHQGGADHNITNRYCTARPQDDFKLVQPARELDDFVLDSDAHGHSTWNVEYDPTYSSSDTICFDVFTQGYSLFQHSGDITFQLAWTITHQVDTPQWVNDPPITPMWNTSTVFGIVTGEWRINWTPFDGSTTEIAMPQHARWLTVSPSATQLTVTTDDPNTIKFGT